MQQECLWFGTVPSEEICPQASPEQSAVGFEEACVFRDQIKRAFHQHFGWDSATVGCKIKIKCSESPLGSYYEVVCLIDDSKKEAQAAADWYEAYPHPYWDEESKFKLGLPSTYTP